ncbi:MAG: CHAD domain-containing protein [Verrucomicrobia bacterium]|nr:MAG: CHAD domain-containing protein [Verrucomicrobiota bacterium]
MHEAVTAMGGGMRERLLGLCDEMDARLHGLLDSKHRVAEGVHQIRKTGKALRGGLALVGMPRVTLAAVTAVGRLLAGQRDAVSRLKTWQRLGWDDRPEVEDPAVIAIGPMLEKLAHAAGRRPPPEAVAWAVARIATVRAALAGQHEKALLANLPQGLRRLRRRLAKQLRKLSLRHRDEPAFHKARKALKAWLGAQTLMGNAADKSCARLAELLGDENDLSALKAWLQARGFSKPVAPRVWQLLRERHRTLRVACMAARDVPEKPTLCAELSQTIPKQP